jgi:superfamily II DNA or RNA helicase
MARTNVPVDHDCTIKDDDPLPTPFSSDDLGRVFSAQTLTRGRSLVLIGAVDVTLEGDSITARIDHLGSHHSATITPSRLGRRVTFESTCSCAQPSCIHLAAASLAALDRFPALRKPEQITLFDSLAAGPPPETRRLVFELAPGEAPHACIISPILVGVQSARREPTTPRAILMDPTKGEPIRALARALGGGDASRIGVSSAGVADMLALLLRSGQARWAPSGQRLVQGEDRVFDANSPPRLPPKSAVLLSSTGPWYVDALSGSVGRVRLRAARATAPEPRPKARREAPALATGNAGRVSDNVIVERPVTPIMRLRRLQCPDDYGRLALLDVLTLDFDYSGVVTEGDDERQFLRVNGPGGPSFVRRDPAAETAAFETLRQDGFVQMRVADGKSAKGRRVLVFRGQDAAERWHRFVAERVPALAALGWRNLIEGNFGPRPVESVGACDVQVDDSARGSFSLDFGIEIDGKRWPLLPILSRLLDRGGIEAAQIVGEDLITSLDDGRVIKLPAERIRRLLAIMGDLIGAAQRTAEGALVLPETEAPTVLDLEDLLTTRWQNAAAVEAYVARFRDAPEILPVVLPAAFKGTLRPYQQHGVNWLQHLGAHGLGGFLADDMGLGKTAQTIAHITVEHAAGRLDRPALIVVPTSLISNWTAELKTFAPHLKVEVLHGIGRHQRRQALESVDVVITTYTVLTRDIEEMKLLPWHIVVLDEAQAIKTPDAKATRAVCQLDARQRMCLSGTPIENNLDELWSQFAFVMPGLLGERREFTRRFRTPIEKKGDDVRRRQLIRRIGPFLLRRTKADVASDLPPKHTILRRITLAPEQRELYETIRVTLHEKVREQVAEHSLARSRIVVLDALLKLRQACCDPRLVKLPSARLVETSTKLEDLLEMVGEMIPEGRRILLFSQFTSMLDLIKPRLDEAGIRFVELRGDTRDRAEPVRAFQAGEVPLFLISLKAGGRGLNLTAADTVIHYDPWWNPAVENQASDRAHRIGQTKSVFVYKLIGADTVEERILELQERKADLANIAFSGEGELAGIDNDDIDFLFGANDQRAAA